MKMASQSIPENQGCVLIGFASSNEPPNLFSGSFLNNPSRRLLALGLRCDGYFSVLNLIL